MANPMYNMYVGGSFLDLPLTSSGGLNAAQSQLKTDGINTLVCWTLHIDSEGNIVLNSSSNLLVEANYNSSSKYVDSTFVDKPGWLDTFIALKEAGYTILFSIGSASLKNPGQGDFYRMSKMLNTRKVTVGSNTFDVYVTPGEGSIGTAEILFNSFKALYDGMVYTNASGDTVNIIDGFVFDDEGLMDVSVLTTLSRMFHNVGVSSVSFCPYSNSDIWIDTLYNVESGNKTDLTASQAGAAPIDTTYTPPVVGIAKHGAFPGFIKGFQLQCYNGGGGNNPNTWSTSISRKLDWSSTASQAFVYPGFWTYDSNVICPTTVQSTFKNFQSDSSNNLEGGFLYNYNIINENKNDSSSCKETPNVQNYISAMKNGLNIS